MTKKSFRLDDTHQQAPFSSSSSRFQSKKVAKRVAHPGPVQSIRDAILKKTMKGGFGSNQPRRSKDDQSSREPLRGKT